MTKHFNKSTEKIYSLFLPSVSNLTLLFPLLTKERDYGRGFAPYQGE